MHNRITSDEKAHPQAVGRVSGRLRRLFSARGLLRVFLFPRLKCHRNLRSEAGGAMVEFALAAPILLSLIFGLIEVCIALYTWQMVSEVAREGTRYAIVRGSACTTSSGASCTATATDVNAFVASSNWPNIGGGTVSPNTTYPDGNENAGSRVQVTVSYVVPFRVAFVSTSPITMSSTSVMYIIQ